MASVMRSIGMRGDYTAPAPSEGSMTPCTCPLIISLNPRHIRQQCYHSHLLITSYQYDHYLFSLEMLIACTILNLADRTITC